MARSARGADAVTSRGGDQRRPANPRSRGAQGRAPPSRRADRGAVGGAGVGPARTGPPQEAQAPAQGPDRADRGFEYPRYHCLNSSRSGTYWTIGGPGSSIWAFSVGAKNGTVTGNGRFESSAAASA